MTLATRVSTLLSSAAGTRLSGGDGAVTYDPIVVDAGTDPAGWTTNCVSGALNAPGATGGSGSFAYAWTRINGGTGTFSADTSLTSTFTATAPGTAGTTTLRLTATDTVTLLTASDDVVLDTSVITVLGAVLLHWWQAGTSAQTLNGALIATLNDLKGSAHLAQATDANRPTYNASGGVNNVPYVSMPRAGDFMDATLSIAAAKRLSLYEVKALGTTVAGTASNAGLFWTDATPTTLMGVYKSTTANFYTRTKPNGAAEQTIAVTVPAIDTAWHLWSIEHLAAGLIAKYDNTACVAAFTGTAAADALVKFRLGHTASALDCKWFASMLLDGPTTAQGTFVRGHFNQFTGL